jgi:hypothetical protein
VVEAYEVHQTVVDGVPVFWTDVEGPRVGSIMFRVGRADEPAALGGITHLVEHLALAPLTQQAYPHNGFVTPTRTVFHASGTDDQLVDYLAWVCRSLTSLPLDRVGMERGILMQEAQKEGNSIGGTLRYFRYGYRGHGLVGQQQLGLGWLGPEPVVRWAAERFTSGNAAVWFSGPPPDHLRLPLADGPRMPPVPLDPIDELTLPAHSSWGGPGVALSYLAARSASSTAALSIIARRARETLRFERGRIYDVGLDYEPLNGATTHCTIATECQPEHTAEVLAELLDIIAAMQRDGATTDELRRETDWFSENARLPGGRMSFLDAAASDELFGRPRETPAEIIEEYEGLEPESVASALRSAAGSLLVLAGTEKPSDSGLHAYPAWSTASVTGREFRPPGLPFGSKARKDRLVVGDEGVMYLTPEGNRMTVRYDQCVAYRHWEGPGREIWGADGFRIRIAASEWRGGQQAVDIVDGHMAPDLVVCDEHGIGALEYPPKPSGAGA